MNTLKIFSILLFSIITFSACIFVALQILKNKKDSNVLLNNQFVKFSSIFIAISIIMNLLFQKVIYLYDIIDKYFIEFDFVKVISLGNIHYGFSSEMLKVITIYMAIAIVWVVIITLFSKLLATKFFTKETWNFQIFEGIILLCLSVAFYPVLSFILDNFYIILEMPKIN